MRTCFYCGHEYSYKGRKIISSGRTYLLERCALCGRNFNGPAMPFVKIPEGVDLEALPVLENDLESAKPCEVCGVIGSELHHWAPHVIFGEESDSWPTSWLCPKHHEEWAQRVKMYFVSRMREKVKNGR